MKSIKKAIAVAMALFMAVGIMPVAGKQIVKAATVDDLITSATSAKNTKGFEITEKGVKVTFDAKMTTNYAWDSPQFTVYTADDDSAENVLKDPTVDGCYFIGRSDNYAFDATGNRWANGSALANENSYVFKGTFTKEEGVDLEAKYTMEAYLVGDSAVITFGNDTFTSTSKVKIDTTKTNYVSVIANYCDITNIEYDELNHSVKTIADVNSASGYAAGLSEAITLTDKPVYISGITTSLGSSNWNGACVMVYNGDDICMAARADVCSNIAANEVATSYGGDWTGWNTRCTEGVGSVVKAYIDGTKVIVTFGNNTFGGTYTATGIDTSKAVTLKISGDTSKTTDLSVSQEADYYDISSYRDTTYTAPTKSGKIFAGWYTDADYTTPVADDATTGYAYAKFVDAALLTTKCQARAGATAESESTDLRMMLAVDGLDYTNVGFDVAYNGNTYKGESTTVFKKIVVTDNETQYTYNPSDFFGNSAIYMLSCILTDIPQENFNKTIAVTPYWTTLDGTKVTGATRSVTITDAFQK